MRLCYRTACSMRPCTAFLKTHASTRKRLQLLPQGSIGSQTCVKLRASMLTKCPPEARYPTQVATSRCYNQNAVLVLLDSIVRYSSCWSNGVICCLPQQETCRLVGLLNWSRQTSKLISPLLYFVRTSIQNGGSCKMQTYPEMQ